MDIAIVGFYQARQYVARTREPIRPNTNFKGNEAMIAANEKKNDDDEVELEATVSKHKRKISELG